MFAKRCYTKWRWSSTVQRAARCGEALSANSPTVSPIAYPAATPTDSPVNSPNKLSNSEASLFQTKKSLDFNICQSAKVLSNACSASVFTGKMWSCEHYWCWSSKMKVKMFCGEREREKKKFKLNAQRFLKRESSGPFLLLKVMFSKMQRLAECTAVLGGAVIAAYA